MPESEVHSPQPAPSSAPITPIAPSPYPPGVIADPICGSPVQLRADKKGRPYIKCSFCGTTCFGQGPLFVAWVGQMSAIVGADLAGHRKGLEKRVAALMAGGGR